MEQKWEKNGLEGAAADDKRGKSRGLEAPGAPPLAHRGGNGIKTKPTKLAEF